MSFLAEIKKTKSMDFKALLGRVTSGDVEKSLLKEKLDSGDLLTLMSDSADSYLEEMAVRANRLTKQHFGSTIGLYAPLYISDFCTNQCTYCGFRVSNRFERRKLTIDEIREEARVLSSTGIRHVLLLTGEAAQITPMDYLVDAVGILKEYFASISIEVFPMDTKDYARLCRAGVDGLTVYQEVYDQTIYQEVHLSGRKTDYEYRLLAPERGAAAGFRAVSIGALLGLGDLYREVFLTAFHARYLEKTYPATEISISLPRIQETEGGLPSLHALDDALFVRFMLAFRLFLPKIGINISTREKADFREKLIHLGATKFSAGSRTDVGGYTKMAEETASQKGPGQFEISDRSSVGEVVAMIRQNGYQPVFKDWEIMT